MLKPVKTLVHRATDETFAIVAAQYNSRYVDAILRAARAELKRACAKQVRVIRVPGAYEIPAAVARLARVACMRNNDGTPGTALAAILCLGVILRGETVHAEHIGEAVSRALMEIQVRY